MIFGKHTDLIEAYKENDMPAFAIFSGAKDILCRYDGEDMDEGSERLENFLKRVETGSIKVKVYSKVPAAGISIKLEPDLVLPYQRKYSPEEKDEYYQRTGVAGMLMGEIRELKAEISEMKRAAVALPEDDEELEDEMQPAPGGILGTILGNPAVQNILANFLTNISASLVAPAMVPRPTALAGTQPTQTMPPIDEQTILALVGELFNKGMTIEDLQKMAAMPPDRVAFLLQILRSNG